MPAVVSKDAVGVPVLVGYEAVQVAILVHVEPDHADGAAGIVDPGSFGDVDKSRAIVGAIVTKETIGAVAQCNEQIEVAVIVVIDETRLAAHA